MGISKVIYGDRTLIDLTNDNVRPDTMLAGYVAHGQNGEQVVGTITAITNEDIDEIINSWR